MALRNLLIYENLKALSQQKAVIHESVENMSTTITS